MQARNLYFKQTANGDTHYRNVRVWDAEKFLASQIAAAKKDDPEATVVVLTQEEFYNETH